MSEPEDEPTKIVCSPGTYDNEVPGSVLVPCEECGVPCWVSPSSAEVLAGGAGVICFHCFKKHVRAAPSGELKIMKHPNAAGQVAEIETWRRQRGRP